MAALETGRIGTAESLATVDEPRGLRRRQLIQATVVSIARHGLASTTLAKVTQIAGLSPGIVNFYFKSKDALLTATLRHLAEEFEAAWGRAVADAGPDAAAQLLALVEISFDPEISDPQRVAVWYAFWGEVQARQDYMKLCGDRDAAYYEQALSLCRQLIAEAGAAHLDATAIAHALIGLVEQLWQGVLVEPARFDRAAAKRTCRAFLASLLPSRFAVPEPAPAQPIKMAENATLPAWVYNNAEIYALERERLFLPGWHIVCHIGEVAMPGDYVAFEAFGERAFVTRGNDGVLRGFHNVCPHRAHAVVEGERGRCQGFLRCPYHGWAFEFDGRLKAVPGEKGFKDFEREAFGLRPLDLEVFCGLIFIRFKSGGPSVAERMAPYAAELAHYRIEEMEPYSKAMWHEPIEIDWKNFWDNYLEPYHFPIGHPGLTDLMGQDYEMEWAEGAVARLSHGMRDKRAKTWSARHYQALLPEVSHLPEALRRRWSYFPLFPGGAIEVYPDKIDFFQVLPSGPGRAVLRGCSYAHPDSRRAMRLARYLGYRLGCDVMREDARLTRSVQGGLTTSGYRVGILSEKEVLVRRFQDWLRRSLPILRVAEPPAPGTVAARNAALVAAG